MKQLAATMKDIDICMFSTIAASGQLTARPMSNNREVEYDGNSYYFTYEDTDVVKELLANGQVGLTFQGGKGTYLSISGKAHTHKDRAKLAEHWTKGLDEWFKEGLDTPGIVMIHVLAEQIRYWKGDENGEIAM